ncbi:hypothetical protein D3C83_171760 [compost metagenome]
MAPALAVDVLVGQAMQRVVDERQQLVKRGFIAVTPLSKQASDVRRVIRRPHDQI